MQTNMALNSDVKNQCSFCSVMLCYSNTVIVNEEIFELLRFMTNGIDWSVLDLLICKGCLEQINIATNFKMSIQRTITNVQIKEEIPCNNSFVKCYSCKTHIKTESSVPFLESPYMHNLLSDLTLKEVFENSHNLKICGTCQSSMMQFHNILDLIFVYCRSKTSDDNSRIKINENQDRTEIKEELLSDDFNLNDNRIMEISVEDEAVGTSDKEDIGVHNFQVKQLYMNLERAIEPVNDERMEVSEHVAVDEMLLSHISKHLKDSNINTTKVFKCHLCKFQSKYKNCLKRHLILTHEEIEKTEIFECNLCKFQTKYRSYLSTHMLCHKSINEVKSFKCHLCNYQSKRKGSLRRHLLIHKDVNKADMFKCRLCKFQTKHRSSLVLHLLIHKSINEIEIFKCNLCKFQTKRKDSLRSHLLIHKDVNKADMFKCHLCKFQTKRKNSLKTHMLIHKDISEIETFKCHLCKYQTKQQSNLERHMLTHKDIREIEIFKCHLCKFQTKRKYSLAPHMLIHKDIKDLEIVKCHLCKFETKQKRYLRRHMLTHKEISEIETFKCHLCKFQTKHKNSLKRHMLTH